MANKPSSEDVYWEEVDTPDPNEFAIAVFVKDTFIRGRMSTFPTGTKLRETPDWIPKIPASTQEYGEYEFIKRTNKDAEYVTYYFGKPKSEEDKNTPFRPAVTSCKNHRWPMVIHALAKIQDRFMGRSASARSGTSPATNIGPQYYLKEAITQECNEGTLFLLEEFLSPTPFDIPQHQVPVATSMKIILPGVEQTYPESLHGRIEIEDSLSSDAQIVAGAASDFGSALSGQVFPATNFEDWRPYYLEDDQKQLECGLWHRWRIRVKPPRKPENTIQ